MELNNDIKSVAIAIIIGLIVYGITCYITYKEDLENPENSGSNHLLAIILYILTLVSVYLFCRNYVFKKHIWENLTDEEREIKYDQVRRVAKYKKIEPWVAENIMRNKPKEFRNIIEDMLQPVRVYE